MARPVLKQVTDVTPGMASKSYKNGPLAQLVEHRTFNPMVPRSSRGRPTIFIIGFICVTLRRR
jgi:hypothetical protein